MGAVKSIGPRRFYSKSNNGKRGSGQGWNILRGYGGKQETVGAMQKPSCFTEIWTQICEGKKQSATVKIGFYAL